MDKILYMIFIASIMVGNGLYFGPCTIRQYCAIFFFIYLIHTVVGKKQYLFNKYSQLVIPYLIFILLYGVSSILSGSFIVYLKQLIALYTVAILAYYSTIIITNKYHTLNFFLNSFIFVGLINAIVNIMQYFGMSIGYTVGALFIDLNDLSKFAQFQHMIQGDRANTFGIMGDIVYNGYYSMILPFALLMRYQNKNDIFKLSIVAFSLISLFVVGERSSFGITFILLVYYLFKRYKKSPILVFAVIILFSLALFYIADFINSDIIQDSRWISSESNIRDNINNAILPFISNNLIIGNLAGFIKLTGFPPHNVIASGFIYAGLIGGCIVIYILGIQMLKSMQVLKSKKILINNAGIYCLYAKRIIS